MKQPIPHTNLKKSLGAVLFTLLFFLLSANSVVGQEITINKVAVENGTICNQFDITLEITGDPPARPQEVVLIIDRSGSMDDGPVPEPIDFAQEAAIDFIENFFDPANNPTGLNKVAIVSYAGSATLDQGLTDSSGEASLIATINAITTGGATNIAQAIETADDELTNNGTFDCATSRSIILLTDGVPTRNSSGVGCSSAATTSSCINDAITAGVNAQTTTVGGEVFEQNVFTIGLIGAISGTQEATALSTLAAIQNSGAFSTEDNADLSGIYDVILGQLVAAARQLPGESLVSDEIDSNFAFVPGSFVASKGTATNAGQLVTWFVDEVVAETITLEYSIVAAAADVCGNTVAGEAVMNYEDSNCQETSQTFNNPSICVPCPEITANIERDGCTADIIYTGTFDEGDCASLSDSFQWEFFLNDVSVGTASSLSGTFTYSGAAPFEGDFRGELTYTGTYGSGCILDPLEATSTINIPSPPQVASVVTDVLCFGDSTGAIDITVTEGTPPYTYAWSNGATTEDISGLAAGSYTVTVTDADGCNNVTTSAIVVSEPNEALEITADITDVACFGENTGAIDVSVTGGTAPYTYSWDSGESTQDLSGLAAGVYELTVTDANGCSDGVASFTVGQPTAALSESAAITDAACFGEATGAIDLTVAGGTAPYTYSWSNGASTEDISGLAAGDYTVDIEDANGCMLSQTYTVGQPAAGLSESASITDAACFGEATGAIDLTVAGGTAPYTYSWSNGASTEDISGLAAGDYTVDIEDA
ncbi:VWA domain-containing protein, partial [Gilvibacter sp.]|uniref:VWA domain-containing protein n=1 Tax=Gilvibacter sp. TaxID=2729997 RepID=UPI0025C238DC